MKLCRLIYLFIGVLLINGCKSQSNNSGNKSDTKLTIDTNSSRIIFLYSVDSVFLPYMPDTNIVFASSDAQRNYFLNTSKKYIDFKNKYDPEGKTDNEIVLAKRNADIMFDDYMDLLNFKFAKRSFKTKTTLGLLSLYSPYSNSSSLEERIALINSYPEEIKLSDIGKKTIKSLGEYSNKKNIGLDFQIFSPFSIIDTNMKQITFKQIFSPAKKYRIIIFGASWCLPCRLEELQLKYWFPLLDTLQIGITAISIDKNFESWKKYIRSDNFQWPAFLINGSMDNQMIKRLDFQGIPRNFLLDSNGRVLGENTDLRKILKEIPIIRTNENYVN